MKQLHPEMPDEERDEVAEDFEAELRGDEPPEDEDLERRAQQEMDAAMFALGGRLQRLAFDRHTQRLPVERRWLEDLRQYHAQYDPDLKAKIEASKSSLSFVNITAPKTDGFAARMADMILPTDEKNWSIRVSPDPNLVQLQQVDDAVVNPETGGPEVDPETGEQVRVSDMAEGLNRALAERCRAMERVIDDQLQASRYNERQREGIDQCAQLGTMVLKGPVVLGKTRKVWQKVVDAGGNAYHEAVWVEDKAPCVEFVDLWNFFPDMSSPDPEAWNDVLERHPVTERQLRALARQPGFDAKRIEQVLRGGWTVMTTMNHLEDLRQITGEHATTNQLKFFELWEYTGPVQISELAACGCSGLKPEHIEGLEDNPLAVLQAKVWFADGVPLKAVLRDDIGLDDHGYRVTWVKRDTTSPFGFGIPRIMRNSQRVACSAWRMIIDNAGLATAPQIIMAMGVRPVDGNWTLYPGKIWVAKQEIVDVRYAMNAFDLPIRLKELMLIFEAAVKLADEETSMPIIMQGDRTPAIPETAEGMSMLFNAASVVQRRFVRFYDDRITKPIITGFYEWNMEFNEREDIKGDWQVVPLGSSALLERERQSQAILQALGLVQSPLIEPRVDVHGLVEDAFRVLRLPNRVKPRAEAENEVARRQKQAADIAAQQGAKGDSGADLQLRQAELEERRNKRMADQQMHSERMAVELEKLSASTGLKREDLLTRLGLEKMKEDGANRRFNTEVALKQQTNSGI